MVVAVVVMAHDQATLFVTELPITSRRTYTYATLPGYPIGHIQRL